MNSNFAFTLLFLFKAWPSFFVSFARFKLNPKCKNTHLVSVEILSLLSTFPLA